MLPLFTEINVSIRTVNTEEGKSKQWLHLSEESYSNCGVSYSEQTGHTLDLNCVLPERCEEL
jgi:hypothetical protein